MCDEFLVLCADTPKRGLPARMSAVDHVIAAPFMTNLLRMTGRVVVCFLVFDVIGVALMLLAELVAALDIVWESSGALGYAVWFVTGVFCAMVIYDRPPDHDVVSPTARRRGTQLVIVTGVIAVAVGMLSSLVWSGGGFIVPVAPADPGVTITYLATVVLGVAWVRFVLLRAPAPATPAPPEGATPFVPESTLFVPDTKRFRTRARSRQQPDDSDVFKPAGIWGTLGLLAGVPVLLFLDASFFLLGPFDYFDRWTDPILKTALAGGLAWGFAAARWSTPRDGLWALHLPLLTGTIFWVFALLLGGLLIGLGAPERVSEIVSYVGLGIGFLFGCAGATGWLAAVFDRTASDPEVRS